MKLEGDKMSKNIKLITTLVIAILVVLNLPIYSRANSLDEIMTNADNFLKTENSSVVTPSQEGIKNMSKTVSNVLLTIALGVTLISAVVMAIQFAFQSIEKKAQIKESMVPWVIGIFISFGAFGIWNITMSVFYQL